MWMDDTKAHFPGLFRDIESCDFAVGDGWQAIIEDLCLDLDAMCIPSLRVAQIKEKFGCLRFYVTGADENPLVYDRIFRAEVEAAITCEEYGRPGESGQFLLTLCPACFRQMTRAGRKLASEIEGPPVGREFGANDADLD